MTRFWRKPVTVVNDLVCGISVILFLNVSDLWLSFALWYLSCFSSGIWIAAARNLALEQICTYKGMMTSLNETARNVGRTIGTALGGLILVLYNYETLGLLGIPALIGSIGFYFLTIDPTTRQQLTESKPEKGIGFSGSVHSS